MTFNVAALPYYMDDFYLTLNALLDNFYPI